MLNLTGEKLLSASSDNVKTASLRERIKVNYSLPRTIVKIISFYMN